MNKGQVSIIIPVYNSEVYIQDTLQSILAQRYQHWECLCVDDGSTDSSLALLRSFALKDKRINVVSRPDHLPKGGNSCRNYGFSKTSGEFVQWFDSDDLMHPEMLSAKVEQLQRYEDYNYVICRTAYFYDDRIDERSFYDQHLDTDNIYVDYLTFKTKFFTPGPLFRRDFLHPMELFNQGLKRHQEKEFFFRVVLRDKRYRIVDEAFILRRMHHDQLSENVNRSADKSKFEFVANVFNYENFVLSQVRDRSVTIYFKDFFFKYIRRFVREGNFKYAVRSLYRYIKIIVRNQG
ncbi:glycosyltransferase family 2 protein [Olivibacter sp. SDN3]|uniref:glycosyltransferase family 2 protein n=1 Tax=Olivibacter sp. SDN3 TaxID=2764720 RepID=UPI00165187D4|nr:glycosyltransferase family 2 protein [Olivibacter sp. SDN3]QNL51598.1 glycosyltransferase family 2 protein [Olivibacter sp. SDN3]